MSKNGRPLRAVSADMKTVAGALGLVMVVTGCGLLRVNGSIVSGPGVGEPSPPTDATADVEAEVPGSDDPRQAALYRDTASVTYKTVSAAQLDITTLQSRYMMPKDVAYSPAPACGANPDPAWIKDWPSESQMSNPPVAAWIQSRILRSYAPDLEAAYKAYRDAWKQFDDTLDAKRKTALALPDFYSRVTALHAAFDEGMKAAESLPAAKKVRPGMLHELIAAVHELYRNEKVSFALGTSGTWATEALRKNELSNLRAWGEDAAERKQFAADAMTGVVPELIAALPVAEYVHVVGGQGGSSVNGWLKWPEDVDVASAPTFFLEADPALAPRSSRTSVAVDYPAKTIEDLKSETKEAILKGASRDEPSLVSLGGLVVALEASAGGGAKVTLEQRDEYSRQECTESGPITSISSSGYVHRQFSNCRIVEQRDTHRRFIVTAKAWPAAVGLGDWVTLSGDLDTVKTTGTVTSSKVEATVTARFVGCFSKGEPLDPKASGYSDKLFQKSHAISLDCALATW